MQRGFALSEVLIAVAVAGLLIVSLLGLFLLTATSANFGLNRARAVQLAEVEMTRHKLAGYATLESQVGLTSSPQEILEGPLVFQHSTRVNRLSSTPSSPEYSLLMLTVTVDWKERRNLDIRDRRIAAGDAQGKLELTSTIAPGAAY